MRLGGLWVVIEMAARAMRDPLVDRWKDAIVLGALREDVMHVPLAGVVEHLSFSHFYQPGLPGGLVPFLWPGPRRKADLFFGRAVERFAAGDHAGAFVQLGRASHLLTDMCCPVHAHRTVHLTDGFEWWVDAHARELVALPVPDVAPAASASALIERMARFTQTHDTDATHHPIGNALRKRGLRHRLTNRECEHQARVLVPQCAAETVALFRLFLAHARRSRPPAHARRPGR